MNMYGVYQAYYSSSLPSSSPSVISGIGSIQAFLLFLVGTLVGPIYDSGYVRLLLILGVYYTLSMTLQRNVRHPLTAAAT